MHFFYCPSIAVRYIKLSTSKYYITSTVVKWLHSYFIFGRYWHSDISSESSFFDL